MVSTATLYSCRSNIHVLLLVAVLFSNFVQGQHCKPKDCLDLQCYRVSKAKDGPHTVYPGTVKLSKVQVSCDQTAESGGWTVYMRRHDGTVNFTSRTWEEYKNGFGQHGGDTELWLGNEVVHQMTIDYRSQDYALRVEVRAFNGTSCGLNASKFFIKSEVRNFKIRFQRILGEERCYFPSRNIFVLRNYPFQTRDKNHNKECFAKYQGGWWYRNGHPVCTEVYLTGKYYSKPTVSDTSMHIDGLSGTLSLTSCAMLFRRNKAPPCNNPCLNNGICEYLEATQRSRCVCPVTHCGDVCEKKNTCMNGGTCTHTSTMSTVGCLCSRLFTGAQCEVEMGDTSGLNATATAKTVWTTPVIAAAGVGIVSIIAIGVILAHAVATTATQNTA